MSEENVEVVRRLIFDSRKENPMEAWIAAAELLDPEIEMDTSRLPVPGLAGVYSGADEVAGFWSEWLDAWGSLGTVEDPELIDAGDRVIYWSTRHELKGKGSGIDVQMPEYAWVVTIRGQKVVRATLYMDKSDALEAARLRE